MNSIERVKAALNHEPADRIPFYCDEFFLDTQHRWIKEGMPADRTEQEDLFDYDVTELFIDSSMRFEPKLLEENEQTIKVADKYGFVATRNKLIPGIHFHEHPIKKIEDWSSLKERLCVDFDQVSRIHEVTYFDPFEKWPTWDQATEIYNRKRATGRYITMRVYGPWEIIWRLRSYDIALMDLYDNRDMLEDIIAHYTDFLIDVITKGMKFGIKPDSFFLLDDVASNKGLFFSPDMIRQLFFPCYKAIGDFLEKNQIDYFFHCCGDNREIIPMYIEAGVNALNPLQATAMDIVDLKKQYGSQLTFLGNINSRIFHDKKAIIQELDRKVPIAMENGGFIFASDHSIPSETSLEDYKLILQHARKLGTYK